MKIVTFASQKGGSGKSTLCFNSFTSAEATSPMAIDLDPQESLVGLGRLRGTDRIQSGSTATLPNQIATARQSGCQWLFLDVAPHASASIYSAIYTTDLVVIPVIPSILDLMALEGITNIIAKTNAKAMFVLNKCSPRVSETQAAIDFLREKHPAIPIGAIIYSRIAYPRACGFGQGVAEYEPNGPAAAETTQMWAAIQEFAHG